MGDDDQRSLFVKRVQTAITPPKGWFSKGMTIRPVTARVDRWTVLVDMKEASGENFYQKWTRLRVRFRTVDRFIFKVQRRNFLRRGGIKIGDPNFDHAFVVKSNDEVKIRALLSSSQIRHLILRTVNTNSSAFQLKRGRRFSPGPPAGVSELYLREEEIVQSEITLASLYDLFAEVLNALGRAGSLGDGVDPVAGADRPGGGLYVL